MTDTTARPDGTTGKNLFQRFIGVLVSPRETFQAVAARPTWLMMALVVILITGGSQMWFQSTEVGRQAALDDAVRRVEAFGMKVNDEMYEGMRKGIMEPNTARVAASAAAMIVIPPVIWAAVAGLLLLIVGALMGGTGTFKQLYAVVVHSSVVSAVGTLILTPVNYQRASMSSATNLAVFFPFLPEGSFLARLLGMADVFTIWWVAVLAIGVAVVSRKKTGTVAGVLCGVYGVIAVAIAAIMAMWS
jgi:hypothetical protein